MVVSKEAYQKEGAWSMLSILFFISFLVTYSAQIVARQFIPFDEALQTAQYADAINRSYHYIGIDGYALYACFKKLYQQYALGVYKYIPQLRIPKIIHQIWLGSPVP